MSIKKTGIILSCFISTYLMSVSIGLNAVNLPQFMESNTALFSERNISLNLSYESLFAIFLSVYLVRIMNKMGWRTILLSSTLIRTVPLFFMFNFYNHAVWSFCIICVGVGTFLFLFLMQFQINSIKITKFKGLIYSVFGTLISLGIASGAGFYSLLEMDFFNANQLIFQYTQAKTNLDVAFIYSAVIGVIAMLPITYHIVSSDNLKPVQKRLPLKSLFLKHKKVLLAVALCGVSFFSVSWYMSIYGTRNSFSVADASLLITFFMMGSVCLDLPLSYLSEFIDRKLMLAMSSLVCTLLCIFLPLAIYSFATAIFVVFVWGGIISSMYSNCIFLIEEGDQKSDPLLTTSVFSLMENVGGVIGIISIGILFPIIGNDGFSYVIILANIIYFSYVLISYKPKL